MLCYGQYAIPYPLTYSVNNLEVVGGTQHRDWKREKAVPHLVAMATVSLSLSVSLCVSVSLLTSVLDLEKRIRRASRRNNLCVLLENILFVYRYTMKKQCKCEECEVLKAGQVVERNEISGVSIQGASFLKRRIRH